MTKSKNDRPIVYANKVPKSFRAHRPKMIQFLARLILRLFGWKIEGEIPEMKENENLVLIAAPHTSNWDGIFGFTAAEFARIRASHMAAQNDDPWLVLGLESGSDIEKTKSQWKRLAAENHPDKLIAKGVPKELLGMANEKLSVINGAYSKILRAHEIKAGSEM